MGKDILFFFPENPFSNRAGNVIRAKTTIVILKKLGYSVDLVGFLDIYNGMKDSLDYNENLIDNLYFISKKPNKNKKTFLYWKYKFISLFRKPEKYNPLLTAYAKDEFQKILAKKKYDAVIINYEYWAGLIKLQESYHYKKIIDTHDWITLNEFYKNPEIDIKEKFISELNNLNFFDNIVTISHDENYIFRGFLGDKVTNIPPSFVKKRNLSNIDKKYDLIFVGSENAFNIKSINWFLNDVYPLLPSYINILIVGRVCKYIEPKHNLELVEFAESLDYYYNQSKISICPMLQGTGVKIKVVEALSYGIPVVGTERAVDGFYSKEANGCLISNDASIFRDNILKLLNDMSYYKNIQSIGESYFDKHFSEKSALEKWKIIFKN